MYALKFQAPKKQKATFRVGQKVTCDYYPNQIFKVVDKEWDQHGTLYYSICRKVGTDKFDNFQAQTGLREKFLNKA
jgi:hypothetical protein